MVKNRDKILEQLKKVNGCITTTELAEKTDIDITNMSKYTKALENEGLIERKIEQKGKIRLVNISLSTKKSVAEKPKTLHPPPLTRIKVITPKRTEPEEMKQLFRRDKLLYEIAYNELNKERERKENLEKKAYRFVLLGDIFLSIISTYFLIFFDKKFEKYYLILLFISLSGLIISLFLFIYSIRTFKYPYFEVGDLIASSLSLKYDDLIKNLTRTFAQNIDKSVKINNKKAKWLYWGIWFFFISLIMMIMGIILFIFNF